jgi:hypothetical protein
MYSKKYLKYKQKYINLKNKFINQVGGAGRTILFTLNDDYITIYQFVINNPSDNLDRFKSLILTNPDQCRILNNNNLIEDNEQFSVLPPFSIINICTSPQNIKIEPLVNMLFDLPEADLSGEETPLRRTLSHESPRAIAQYTQQKSLNLFLYDVKYSKIDFYLNRQKVLVNYYTTQVQYETGIKVIFDSGNAAKTLISDDVATRLGCIIRHATPDPDFIAFCVHIRQYFVDTRFNLLYDRLLQNDMNSREIHIASEKFLNRLKQDHINLYRQFIRLLNLRIFHGVNSSTVGGFATTSFEFLVKGTEENFMNRKGNIIPLRVDAEVVYNKERNFVLINDKTIKTLEYYKLFLFVSDSHFSCHTKETNQPFVISKIAAIKRGLTTLNMGDDMLEPMLDTDRASIEKINTEKSEVVKMPCEGNFYKFDINDSKIELLNIAGGFVEPQEGYNIIFDTGNAAVTMINSRFIAANPTIIFNPETVKPRPEFYDFITNLLDRSDTDQELRFVLSRFLDRNKSSEEIYAEFIGSTSTEFQDKRIPYKFKRQMKDIFITYLNLRKIGDVNEISRVIGGTKYRFNLKISNTPDDKAIEIEAISNNCITPINLLNTIIDGANVRIRGLQQNPEMNGRTGIANTYNESTGRWRVNFDDGNQPTYGLFLPQKMEIIYPQEDVDNCDILISVIDNNKLNKKSCFIGNLQAKFETLQHLQNLREEIEQADPNDHDLLEGLMQVGWQYKHQKYNAEMKDCMDDYFIEKKFYEDLIKTAADKLTRTLRSFKSDVFNLIQQVPNDTKLNDLIKKLEVIVSIFGRHQISDIHLYNISSLKKIIVDLDKRKKEKFLPLLQEAVIYANEIRSQVSPLPQKYRISDEFILLD